MENVLESYLVSLGFKVDQPELAKFKTALKDAGAAAEHHTSGIIGQFVKWQAAIVGSFAAVGLATVGMMDKVADADLGFKITAQRMFLGVNAARSLTIATKELGYSLEDIAWNPELHKRFEALWADQQKLTQGLGPGFERTMERIRDVRFEITRMQVALQYIAMNVVQKLFTAFGGDSILTKLRGWTEWVIAHAPQISDWITKTLVPILKDALRVLQDVWKVTEALARAFIRLIGAFSGDKELQKGALTFDSMGKAIDKAADYMVRFVDAVTSAELVVIDLFNALVDLLSLNFKDFGKDLGAAGSDLTGGGAGVLGIGLLGGLLGAKTVGALIKLLGGAARAGLGGIAEGAGAEAAAGGAGVAGVGIIAPLAAGAGAAYVLNKLGVAGWIDRHMAAMGIDPTIGPNIFDGSGAVAPQDVVGAVAKQESGGKQFDKNGNVIRSSAGALGIMQLMPDTARRLGVDPYDEKQNLEGGTRLLAQLFKKYGNLSEVLAAYNWGEGNLDKAMKRHGGFSLDYLPKETRDYVNRIEGGMAQQVSIHAPITIHGTNATPEQIKTATRDGISEAMERSSRKGIFNAEGAYA